MESEQRKHYAPILWKPAKINRLRYVGGIAWLVICVIIITAVLLDAFQKGPWSVQELVPGVTALLGGAFALGTVVGQWGPYWAVMAFVSLYQEQTGSHHVDRDAFCRWIGAVWDYQRSRSDMGWWTGMEDRTMPVIYNIGIAVLSGLVVVVGQAHTAVPAPDHKFLLTVLGLDGLLVALVVLSAIWLFQVAYANNAMQMLQRIRRQVAAIAASDSLRASRSSQ